MAKVGVDIGHGINTFPPNKGVIRDGKGYAEHTFNASVATALKELLEAQGHTVYMAQQPFKIEVPLLTRTKYYNSLDLDLVISIHGNAGVAKAEGLCAFYWKGSAKGKKAADLYAKYIKEYGYTAYSGGTFASQLNHWSNFHMLRETKAPSILTENGFMTNDKEFELIFKSEKFVKEVAEVHAKLVADYFGVKFANKKVEVEKTEPVETDTKPNNVNTSQGRSETVKEIQQTLNSRYVTKISPDGYDGPKTRSALVKALQVELNKQYKSGLTVDGLWGTKTRAAIVTIRKGAKGNMTWILQALLFLNGYNTGGLDSMFGQGTEKALISFQINNRIAVDGVAGKGTFEALIK
jgi:N-acetylmuramoyl-L-alanine amidase